MPKKKDSLEQIEVEVVAEIEKKRLKRRNRRTGVHAEYRAGKTKIAEDVKARNRLPPPVPKNKALSEIVEMDPDHPEFRHNRGVPRKWTGEENLDDLDWRDILRQGRQQRAGARRAKVRKYEATMVKAQEVLNGEDKKKYARKGGSNPDAGIEVYDEDRIIAEGIVTLDDWDNEELVRGYRRDRNGKFGTPPKYIPREVQQEAFRRLVQRGDRKMREAYMKTVEELIELAHNASSEKVRLEAQKELMNRTIGKVPDRLMVATDQPWEGILADSLVPISELPPVDLPVGDDGVARMDPVDE